MNFKDIINEARKKAVPNKESIRESVLTGKDLKLKKHPQVFQRWISIAVVICFAFVAMFAGNLLFGVKTEAEDFRDGFSLKAMSTDKYGVLPNSAFLLKSRNPATLEEIKTWLSLSDGTKLDIKDAKNPAEVGIVAFDIKPMGGLASDKIYKFVLAREGKDDVTWGYQTTSKMQVVGSLPGKEATGIQVLSGIEIYFSRIGNYMDASKFFSISPNVEGNLKTEQGRIVFVPKNPLDYGTVYTVKVLKGFGVVNSQNVIEKDFEFSFETVAQNQDESSYYFSSNNYYFYPGIAQTVSLPYWGNGYSNPVKNPDISIFKYSDFDSFQKDFQTVASLPGWAYSTKTAMNLFSETDKTLVLNFKPKARDDGSYKIPKSLEEGFYLIRATAGNSKSTALIQVNSLAIQIVAAGDSKLAWVMNGKTETPVANSSVEFSTFTKEGGWQKQGATLQTGTDGVAKFDSGDFGERLFKVSPTSGQVLLYLYSSNVPYYSYYSGYNMKTTMPTSGTAGDWWNYLALDKPLYQMTDTLQFWGFAQNRKTSKSPATLDVEVKQGWGTYYFDGYGYAMEGVSWYNDDNSSPALLTSSVDVEKGVFSGDMSLSSLSEGTYSLSIKSEGTLVSQKSFEVKKYEKPEFQFTASSNKSAMFWNEVAKIDLGAKFFDGTGVPNTKASYVANGGRENVPLQSGKFNLNEQGEFTYLYSPAKLNYPIDSTQLYSEDNISFSSVFPLVGEMSKDQIIQVFHHDKTGDFEAKEVGGKLVLTGVVKKVNPKIDSEKYKVAPGTKVTGQFEYRWTTEVITGYKYDSINKVKLPQYRYDEHSKIVKTYNLKADKNGKINLSFAIPKKPDRNTEIIVTVNTVDSWGRNYTQELYVYGDIHDIVYANEYNPTFTASKETAAIGDNVKFIFSDNGKKVPDKYSMFLVMNNGLVDYTVIKGSEYSLKFAEKHSPGIEVEMIRFLQGGCESYSATVMENLDKKGLNITLTPDKSKYLPGGKAKFTLKVLDKNGKPVECVINLSLLDNALLALQSQEINVASELYSFPGSGYGGFESSMNSDSNDFWATPGVKFYKNELGYAPSQDTAVVTKGLENGIANGGSSPVAVRKNFQDVAAFKLVKTDSSGNAEVTIQMPDNITSWRAIASGISESRLAGQANAEVVTSLDMFIQPTIGGEYIVGDSPVFAAAVFGDKLKSGDKITYTTEIITPDGKVRNVGGNALAFKQVQIPIGKLAEGEYIVKITARSGAFADAIEKKFRVLKSFLKHLATYSVDAVPGAQFKTAQGLVDLMFADKELGKVYEGFARIAYNFDSNLDGLIASIQSQKFINEKFYSAGGASDESQNLNGYQSANDGGLSIQEKGTSNVYISALVAGYVSGHPELGIDKAKLVNYLLGKAQNGLSGEKGAAIYGLITMGEPKIDMLNELASVGNLGIIDSIYLALAYDFIGETPKAGVIFNQKIEPNIQTSGSNFSIKGLSGDEQKVATILAAVLASQLKNEKADGLYNFVIENPAVGTLTSLQEYMFMTSKYSRVDRTETKVVYELNGKQHTITVNGAKAEYFTITGEQLKNLKIISGGTSASITITQWENGLPADAIKNEVKMTTKFYPINSSKETKVFKPGDVLKVFMKIDLSKYKNASFEVTSALPANMRAVANTSTISDVGKMAPENIFSYAQVDGQLVSFYAYKYSDGFSYLSDTATVYVRIITGGNYVKQPMFSKDYDTGKFYVN